MYRHYGDESCISVGGDNSLNYADEEYAEDSILCRTLNLVGNFYPTPKEAQN